MVSKFVVNCTVDRGTGRKLDVIVYRNEKLHSRDWKYSTTGGGGEGEGREVEMLLEGVVSFKEAIDFREKFSKFSELGVGGLKREIDELYRRAFASRGAYPLSSISLHVHMHFINII